MMLETITYRQVIDWLNDVWAKSLAAVLALVLGWSLGSMHTESKIIGDCKFAGAFRVDVQAFQCQRRI